MTSLKPGDIAPDFESVDQNGNPVSLAALRGRRVILYFYPKDDTPGCTAEACSLRDNIQVINDKNAVVIGVSADSEQAHKKFSEKYVLPFALIPDKARNIIRDYGAWGKKKLYGKEYEGILRLTFLIDEEGRIAHIFTKVDTKNHAAQVLEQLNK